MHIASSDTLTAALPITERDIYASRIVDKNQLDFSSNNAHIDDLISFESLKDIVQPQLNYGLSNSELFHTLLNHGYITNEENRHHNQLKSVFDDKLNGDTSDPHKLNAVTALMLAARELAIYAKDNESIDHPAEVKDDSLCSSENSCNSATDDNRRDDNSLPAFKYSPAYREYEDKVKQHVFCSPNTDNFDTSRIFQWSTNNEQEWPILESDNFNHGGSSTSSSSLQFDPLLYDSFKGDRQCSSIDYQNSKDRHSFLLEDGDHYDHQIGEEDEEIMINTKELANQISKELRRYGIPQAVFAQQVLSRSQGTLSDLLRNPKPWKKLKAGRETFRKMWHWLQEPENERIEQLRNAVNKRKTGTSIHPTTDQVFDSNDYFGIKMELNEFSTRLCFEEKELSDTCSPPPLDSSVLVKSRKRSRLVFTDIQRRTLQAIFKETKRPSKEMQITISRQLGLQVSTVSNFFMNARRRSMDKWKDDEDDDDIEEYDDANEDEYDDD